MSVIYSSALNYSEELPRIPEMDSNIGHPQQHCHQPNSGLLRYQSAPSSLLASLVDSSHDCPKEEASRIMEQNNLHLPSLSSEMDTMLAKLISSNNEGSNPESMKEYGGGKLVKQEAGESVLEQNGYCYGSQTIYQNQQPQSLQNGNLGDRHDFDGSYVDVNYMENSTQSKMISRNCSNLVRQKSSPAEFFSNISPENGFASLGELESLRSTNGQSTCIPTTSGGLNGNMNFSSRPSACSRRMPQIAENQDSNMEGNFVESRNLGNDNGLSKCYMSNFTNDLWEGSAFQKSSCDFDEIMFSTSDGFETQNVDFGDRSLGLTRHLSLPSSSTKMSAMEKILHIQESVPCKIRAKRGFATHPRSIAERERRSRISERIKKLQDLFPKSDKQTNTADMLDLAVDYIKDLQKQVKMLTDTRAKCTCSSGRKQF